VSTTDTLIIGAGHAGLAMSWHLTERGVDHVVVERGRLAERWRSARWDSFRLITPSWLARLPGWSYQRGRPDGFMSAAEFVSYLDAYAGSFAAPVSDHTTVVDVREDARGFVVRTDRGSWAARNVIIATGYHSHAVVPPYAAGLSLDVAQVTPAGYRGPAQLPGGGVLVVGASASGVQIADELARDGRRVVLAVGSHTRLARRYRGRDIFWWLDRIGSLDRTIDELPEAAQASREPSPQLSGSGRRVDLNALRDREVRLVGRLTAVEATTARFAADLGATTAAADARLRRVLASIDAFIDANIDASIGTVTGTAAGAAFDGDAMAVESEPEPVPPVLAQAGPDRVDLRREGISTVVWATGYRPWYPWLRVPVLDPTGRIRHRRGATAAPGLYAIGLRFQHRRSSTFIDGARHDAAYLADHIAARSRGRRGREAHASSGDPLNGSMS
jgi:putative flavoprotein involved in K+ transport